VVWRELLTNPWWEYQPGITGGWGLAYRWFNLCEAAVWLAFALLVLRRWRRERKSSVELAYAVAFAIFGLTDVREAYVISLPLVAVKGVNLAVILLLRQYVLRRCYPGRGVY
jgi:hypothetical protein